jgi:hypothetical protein
MSPCLLAPQQCISIVSTKTRMADRLADEGWNLKNILYLLKPKPSVHPPSASCESIHVSVCACVLVLRFHPRIHPQASHPHFSRIPICTNEVTLVPTNDTIQIQIHKNAHRRTGKRQTLDRQCSSQCAQGDGIERSTDVWRHCQAKRPITIARLCTRLSWLVVWLGSASHIGRSLDPVASSGCTFIG